MSCFGKFNLISVFAVRMKKAWVLSYPLSAQRRLWSDWADAQADLSLCWAHMPFCWFCSALAHFRAEIRKIFIQITLLSCSMPGPEVIKLFSCSTHLSMKFVLLISLKLLTIASAFLLNITIVGVFIFISGEKLMLSWVEHKKSFITSGSDLGHSAHPYSHCHLLIFSQWVL